MRCQSWGAGIRWKVNWAQPIDQNTNAASISNGRRQSLMERDSACFSVFFLRVLSSLGSRSNCCSQKGPTLQNHNLSAPDRTV